MRISVSRRIWVFYIVFTLPQVFNAIHFLRLGKLDVRKLLLPPRHDVERVVRRNRDLGLGPVLADIEIIELPSWVIDVTIVIKVDDCSFALFLLVHCAWHWIALLLDRVCVAHHNLWFSNRLIGRKGVKLAWFEAVVALSVAAKEACGFELVINLWHILTEQHASHSLSKEYSAIVPADIWTAIALYQILKIHRVSVILQILQLFTWLSK